MKYTDYGAFENNKKAKYALDRIVNERSQKTQDETRRLITSYLKRNKMLKALRNGENYYTPDYKKIVLTVIAISTALCLSAQCIIIGPWWLSLIAVAIVVLNFTWLFITRASIE